MSFHPLASILKENKLEGNNYIDWKRNLDIVLIAEDIKFVLETPCPPEPAANASNAVKEIYRKWQKADEMARCYILSSMSNVLQHQHQALGTATEMMVNLGNLFGTQMAQTRESLIAATPSSSAHKGGKSKKEGKTAVPTQGQGKKKVNKFGKKKQTG